MELSYRKRTTSRGFLVLAWLTVQAGLAVDPAAANEAPGTAQSGPGDGAVIARVGSETILAGDLRKEMIRRGGSIPGRYATTEQRLALLEEMIRARAVIQAARSEGYDRDPDFIATVERMLTARYLDAHLEAEREGLETSDAEVEAFYRTHAAEFQIPARARGAWIFLEVPRKATPEKVEEARLRAEALRAEALALPAATKNFGELAQKSSDDPGTRYIGGEFGWVTAPEVADFRYGPEVAAATLALATPGEISAVLRTAQGFALVKLVAREEAGPAPIEKMAPGIRNRIEKERRAARSDAFYGKLLKDLPVTRDEAAVAAIAPVSPPAGAAKPTPPPLPGSR